MSGNGVKYWPHTAAAPKNDFDSPLMEVVYDYVVPLSNSRVFGYPGYPGYLGNLGYLEHLGSLDQLDLHTMFVIDVVQGNLFLHTLVLIWMKKRCRFNINLSFRPLSSKPKCSPLTS